MLSKNLIPVIRLLFKEKMKRNDPPESQGESRADDESLARNYSIQLKGTASASTAQPSGSISAVTKPTPSARSKKRTKGGQKRKKAAKTTSSPTITKTQGKKKKKDANCRPKMAKTTDGTNRKLKKTNKTKMKYYIVSERNIVLRRFVGRIKRS